MTDNKEKLIKVLKKVEKSGFIGFYNDKTVNLRIENDLFILFNSYYFKDKLKNVGFLFDAEISAWVGDFNTLCALEENVLERLLQSMSKKSIIKIKNYIESNFDNDKHFLYNLT